MLKPTNSAAEQIVALRSINGDIDTQIASLQSAQARNLETITAFEEIATWEEIADETPSVEEEVLVSDTVAPEEEVVLIPWDELPAGDPALEEYLEQEAINADTAVVEPDPISDPAPTPEVPSDAEPAPVPAVDEPVQAAPRTAAKKKK